MTNLLLERADVHFIVPGRPIPKERARIRKDGRAYTPKRTREYQTLVGWCCRQAMGARPPFSGPVTVGICLRYRAKTRPADVDNCAKAILDGLTGVAWEDDLQVSGLMVFRSVRPVREDEEEYAEVGIWPRVE